MHSSDPSPARVYIYLRLDPSRHEKTNNRLIDDTALMPRHKTKTVEDRNRETGFYALLLQFCCRMKSKRGERENRPHG